MLKVRVIANGYLDGRLYTPGDEINLDNKKKFCAQWMEGDEEDSEAAPLAQKGKLRPAPSEAAPLAPPSVNLEPPK